MYFFENIASKNRKILDRNDSLLNICQRRTGFLILQRNWHEI